jgi:hypothetical protein
MSDKPRYERVLAVHPTTHGFGWALLEAPDALLDWGLAHSTSRKAHLLVNRFEKLISLHKPSVLVLEEYAGKANKRAKRIQSLYKAFERTASEHQVPFLLYERETVAAALEMPSGTSRYDIAKAVAARLEDLSHRLPRKRKLGDAEDARQSLFAAAALALTRYIVLGLD